MDRVHQTLYIRWCQSPPVVLYVGEFVGVAQKFLVPQEFLRRRSQTFRQLLKEHKEDGSPVPIPLPDTTIPTMEEFFVWTFAPQPHIDDRLDFADVTKLGIFAWRYQLASLSNQVTDMIRGNLATGEWQLQASLVDDIYQAAPAGSPLREVIRGALGQLPRESVEEWEDTFKKHADLGWDYIKAGGKEWTRQEYLTDVCRFHDHKGIKRPQGLCDGCPYAHDDCYPRWEEEDPEEPQASDEQEAPEPPEEETIYEELAVDEAEDVPEIIDEPEEPKEEGEDQAITTFMMTELPEEEEAPRPEEEAEEVPPPVEEVEEAPPPEEEAEEAPPLVEDIEAQNGIQTPEESQEATEEANGTETPHQETTNINGNGNGMNGTPTIEETPSESMFDNASTVAPDSVPSDREGPAVMEATPVSISGNSIKNDRKNEAATVTVKAAVVEAESPKTTKKKGGKKKRQSFSYPIR